MNEPLDHVPADPQLSASQPETIDEAPPVSEAASPREDATATAALEEVAPPEALTPPPPPGNVQVLQKLSTPPFPRSGFPLLGILASTYEHITAVAHRMKNG